MKYLSTRGGASGATFSEILLEGLMPNGGLAVPETLPRIDAATLAVWRALDYRALAFEIIHRFADDIPAADLRTLLAQSYTRSAFGSDEITPVRELSDGVYILGLSFGPTLAFKDVAMQLLGNLFEYALAKAGRELNILGATSGDTGSAAEYAMRGKRAINVFMLSPHQKMSPFQTAQMFSLTDPNIHNIAIRGVFDDCQDLVKEITGDLAFKRRYRLGAVNSINWARVVAQVVYYFKAYFAVAERIGDPVSFAVPSGNFGNIYAGHVARSMGLPIRKLILATNENDVLHEFFRSGLYRVRPSHEVHQTSSPSMDISKASNFERFIWELTGGNGREVARLWSQLATDGEFDLAQTPLFAGVGDFGFVSGSSTHADRLATIARVYREHGQLVDPHTADGIKVGLEQREAGVPLVCLETALPAKFGDTVRAALQREPEIPAALGDLMRRPQRFTVMDNEADAVRSFIAEQVPQ